MDYIELDQYVSKHVCEKRLAHCRSTASQAEALLTRFEPTLEGTAGRVVGLWHDVAREWGEPQLLDYCLSNNVDMEPEEMRHPMLLHGAVGAHLLLSFVPGAEDAWRTAIRWHTLGSPDMGFLGAVLFVADYLEPLRSYIDEDTRKAILGKGTLEEICLEVVQQQLLHIQLGGKSPASSTLALAEFLHKGGSFGT